jgi:hypothetical protein
MRPQTFDIVLYSAPYREQASAWMSLAFRSSHGSIPARTYLGSICFIVTHDLAICPYVHMISVHHKTKRVMHAWHTLSQTGTVACPRLRTSLSFFICTIPFLATLFGQRAVSRSTEKLVEELRKNPLTRGCKDRLRRNMWVNFTISSLRR